MSNDAALQSALASDAKASASASAGQKRSRDEYGREQQEISAAEKRAKMFDKVAPIVEAAIKADNAAALWLLLNRNHVTPTKNLVQMALPYPRALAALLRCVEQHIVYNWVGCKAFQGSAHHHKVSGVLSDVARSGNLAAFKALHPVCVRLNQNHPMRFSAMFRSCRSIELLEYAVRTYGWAAVVRELSAAPEVIAADYKIEEVHASKRALQLFLSSDATLRHRNRALGNEQAIACSVWVYRRHPEAHLLVDGLLPRQLPSKISANLKLRLEAHRVVTRRGLMYRSATGHTLCVANGLAALELPALLVTAIADFVRTPTQYEADEHWRDEWFRVSFAASSAVLKRKQAIDEQRALAEPAPEFTRGESAQD